MIDRVDNLTNLMNIIHDGVERDIFDNIEDMALFK